MTVDRRFERIIPRSRENGGPVYRGSDRPSVTFKSVDDSDAAKIISETPVPLTPVIGEDRGFVTGGGFSRESIRRARKRGSR